MYVLSFERESVSGDCHDIEILCLSEHDAQQIQDYIIENFESNNLWGWSIERYTPPAPVTFSSWVKEFGGQHED